MSTFDGKVKEFPDIRIDYFRTDPLSRPPLGFFLGHVHSDHLVGLENCKSPFIYCSPGTRDILLRLEKYPHRMNFAKGILETRKQTYRHLKNLLKAIPLDTPTVIELAPGNEVRVTLLDANHCVGAVMFLIEGGGKAVLYTGDIRSESWWVDSLKRNPVLASYSAPPGGAPLNKLDCIYLDTTFVVSGREDPYCHFPPKADGLAELLQKVAQYPKDTLFYVDAWTFGYEDVWQALANFLGSQVHVDRYRHGMYSALASGIEPRAPEAVKLIGFHCGNHYQRGCLTSDQSQIHSCEKGMECEIWSRDYVRITPIVSRHNGMELAELGTGGGQGDLAQQHELDVADPTLVGQLMALCATKLQGQTPLLTSVLNLLSTAMTDGTCSINLEDFDLLWKSDLDDDIDPDTSDISLEKLIPALSRCVTKSKMQKADAFGQGKPVTRPASRVREDGLPTQITFPYSRHSSYEELCMLLEAFVPRDIYPCTVDEKNRLSKSSMSALFGHMYSDRTTFTHDETMMKKRGDDTKSGKQVSDSSIHDMTAPQRVRSDASGPRRLNISSDAEVDQRTVNDRDRRNNSTDGHGSARAVIRAGECKPQLTDRRPVDEGRGLPDVPDMIDLTSPSVAPRDGKLETKLRNARRRDGKKLQLLKGNLLLSSQANLEDMRRWERDNSDRETDVARQQRVPDIERQLMSKSADRPSTREAQGDFWPPLDVDHYCPSNDVDHYASARQREKLHKHGNPGRDARFHPLGKATDIDRQLMKKKREAHPRPTGEPKRPTSPSSSSSSSSIGPKLSPLLVTKDHAPDADVDPVVDISNRGPITDSEACSPRNDRPLSREAQGSVRLSSGVDYYSPLNADHYAKEREQEKRRKAQSTSKAASLVDHCDTSLDAQRSLLGTVGTQLPPSLRDRWLKRIADDPRANEGPWSSVKRHKAEETSERYGRLTPPDPTPFNGQNLPGSKRSGDQRTSSPATMAFRRQAHDAVDGSRGLSWFDIGLVSVGGHQEEEEEL